MVQHHQAHVALACLQWAVDPLSDAPHLQLVLCLPPQVLLLFALLVVHVYWTWP
jgi:hypothetical protein